VQSLIDRASARDDQGPAAASEHADTVPGAPPKPAGRASPTCVRTRSQTKKLEDIISISKKQVLANWDPSYPGEPVSWYDEYIQRYGPVVTNWFQAPRPSGETAKEVLNEVQGLALFTPGCVRRSSATDPLFAVSPLEDGTVCLFDVNGTSTRRGAVLGSSRPGLLYSERQNSASTKRWRKHNPGLTESVSVDGSTNRGYFAIESRTCIFATSLNLLCHAGQVYRWPGLKVNLRFVVLH
jgi:hypothetical protein